MIEATAIQLRRAGDQLEVLVEISGFWRRAIKYPWPADGTGQISYIAEAAGSPDWPVVDPAALPLNCCTPCLGCGGFRRENCKDFPHHNHDWCDCQ